MIANSWDSPTFAPSFARDLLAVEEVETVRVVDGDVRLVGDAEPDEVAAGTVVEVPLDAIEEQVEAIGWEVRRVRTLVGDDRARFEVTVEAVRTDVSMRSEFARNGVES